MSTIGNTADQDAGRAAALRGEETAAAGADGADHEDRAGHEDGADRAGRAEADPSPDGAPSGCPPSDRERGDGGAAAGVDEAAGADAAVDDAAAAEAAGADASGAREGELAARVAELQDRLLRRQADFENFRKRQYVKRDEEILNARTAILLDVADVIDDLERALRTGADADAATLRDGVSSIEKKLTGVLERKWGFRRFSSKGEPFDPERHQAIAMEDSGAHDAATVVEDYQSGYLLHDRVVRTARVKVAQPLSGSNEERARAPGDASADTKEGT